MIRTWVASRGRGARAAVVAAAAAAVAGGGYQVYTAVVAGGHYREALAAADRGDQTAARRHLAACLAEWPDSGEVNFLMARAARRDGDFPTAEKFLKRAEAAGWTPDAVAMERTLLRAQTGDFRRVEGQILQWAGVNSPDRPLFLEVLVPVYLRRHDLNRAYDLLVGWAEREPHNAQVQVWLTEACERLRIPQGAMDAARAAAAAAPDDPAVRLKCGQLLIENHLPAEAAPHFDRVLELKPTDPAARTGLARCWYELGDVPGAVELLDRVMAHPETADPAGWALRGAIALNTGQTADAVRHLTRAAELTPHEPDVLSNLALALEQAGRAEEAKAYRARHDAARKDLTELAEVTRQIAQNPRSAELRCKAGMIMLRNGHPEFAAGWLRSALAEDPAYQPARDGLAAATRAMTPGGP